MRPPVTHPAPFPKPRPTGTPSRPYVTRYQRATNLGLTQGAYDWLTGAATYSAEILEVLGQPPPPDPPNPDPPNPLPPNPNPGDGDMDQPTNTSQLRDALMTYRSELRIGMLDPRTYVEMQDTIEIPTTASGNPWGVNGNGAKLVWRGSAGQDMLVFTGQQDQNCRGLTVAGMFFDGNDPYFNKTGARACLTLSAPLGDYGPIYQFNLRDLYACQARNGIVLMGGVYEGQIDNPQVENCSEDGVYFTHMNLGQPGQAVVSNIHVNHLNSSRNLGAGLKTVYSVSLVGGSFVLNGRGIDAPDGLRSIAFANFENTAGPSNCAIDLGSNGYGSVIFACEGSSDGRTFCRKWDGTKWVDVGAPLLYLMNDVGQDQMFNHMSYYGNPPNPLRVVK